jgi:hypothetical protein
MPKLRTNPMLAKTAVIIPLPMTKLNITEHKLKRRNSQMQTAPARNKGMSPIYYRPVAVHANDIQNTLTTMKS